jgi:hypothetical protein
MVEGLKESAEEMAALKARRDAGIGAIERSKMLWKPRRPGA